MQVTVIKVQKIWYLISDDVKTRFFIGTKPVVAHSDNHDFAPRIRKEDLVLLNRDRIHIESKGKKPVVKDNYIQIKK